MMPARQDIWREVVNKRWMSIDREAADKAGRNSAQYGSGCPTERQLQIGFLRVVEGLKADEVAEQEGIEPKSVDAFLAALAVRLGYPSVRPFRHDLFRLFCRQELREELYERARVIQGVGA